MATTVQIIFSGIVYLVGNAAGGHVDVILPNASGASAPFGHAISEHTAYVRIERTYLNVAASADPTFRLTRTGEYWIYVLDGEKVTLSAPNRTPDPLEICKTSACGNYDNLAHREIICPSCGKLDSAFRDYKNRDIVAATMLIDKGTLSANPPPPIKWIFRPAVRASASVSYPPREVAKEAVLNVKSETGTFTLELDHPKNGVRKIELNDGAKVYVENMPLADFAGAPAHCEAVDEHFALYYTMMLQPVPADPYIPHRENLPNCAALGPRQNCPPLADEVP